MLSWLLTALCMSSAACSRCRLCNLNRGTCTGINLRQSVMSSYATKCKFWMVGRHIKLDINIIMQGQLQLDRAKAHLLTAIEAARCALVRCWHHCKMTHSSLCASNLRTPKRVLGSMVKAVNHSLKKGSPRPISSVKVSSGISVDSHS